MHKTCSDPHWFYVNVHELMLHVELSIVTWVWGSVIRFQTASWRHLTSPVFNKSNVKQSQKSVFLYYFKFQVNCLIIWYWVSHLVASASDPWTIWWLLLKWQELSKIVSSNLIGFLVAVNICISLPGKKEACLYSVVPGCYNEQGLWSS